jgi:hypothetical protein
LRKSHEATERGMRFDLRNLGRRAMRGLVASLRQQISRGLKGISDARSRTMDNAVDRSLPALGRQIGFQHRRLVSDLCDCDCKHD